MLSTLTNQALPMMQPVIASQKLCLPAFRQLVSLVPQLYSYRCINSVCIPAEHGVLSTRSIYDVYVSIATAQTSLCLTYSCI